MIVRRADKRPRELQPGVTHAVLSYGDALMLCEVTIDKGVTAIPLSPFYETPPAGQRLVRLCFAKNEATMDAAFERLQALLTTSAFPSSRAKPAGTILPATVPITAS